VEVRALPVGQLKKEKKGFKHSLQGYRHRLVTKIISKAYRGGAIKRNSMIEKRAS
jgi:hypothetical protein